MVDKECLSSLHELLGCAGLPLPTSSSVQITGPADPVVRTRYKVAQAGTASIGAVGVAASELFALKTGRKQTVHLDTREVVTTLAGTSFMKINDAIPPHERDLMGGFYQMANGRWFMLHCNFPHLRDAAAKVLGVPPVREAAAEAFKQFSGDAEALETALFEGGGCGAYVRTPEEWSQTSQAIALRHIPLLELRRIGDAPREPLPEGPMPLSGLRSLDLTRVIAGPTCSRILAEYGADVLRITREGLPDTGLNFIDTGVGKLSAFTDMRDSSDDTNLRELIRTGDLFVQSYRPGTLASRGYSPEDVAAIRPGAIYVTLNAWGHGGPWEGRRGFDTVVQSASGMAHFNALNGRPAYQPVSALDYISGALMAFGAMTALHRRATEGGSWLVQTSLAGAMQWLVAMGTLNDDEMGSAPNHFPAEAVQNLYADIVSPFGKISYLRPPIRLSETSPLAVRPPVPFGYHPAAWPT